MKAELSNVIDEEIETLNRIKAHLKEKWLPLKIFIREKNWKINKIKNWYLRVSQKIDIFKSEKEQKQQKINNTRSLKKLEKNKLKFKNYETDSFSDEARYFKRYQIQTNREDIDDIIKILKRARERFSKIKTQFSWIISMGVLPNQMEEKEVDDTLSVYYFFNILSAKESDKGWVVSNPKRLRKRRTFNEYWRWVYSVTIKANCCDAIETHTVKASNEDSAYDRVAYWESKIICNCDKAKYSITDVSWVRKDEEFYGKDGEKV